jgi:hypothetical protein
MVSYWAEKYRCPSLNLPSMDIPNYKLRSLSETEAFIQRNGHLPEVPCAEEIAEKGADLGELHKVLLKKMEEMTLHMIRMEKELAELKKQK